MFTSIKRLKQFVLGEQGWRSGEVARLPPMWPGLDSRTRRHMWVEFVVNSRPCSEGFSPGTLVFLPPQKTNISKFQFDLELVECLNMSFWLGRFGQPLPTLST